jgi:hypothetical protein
VGCPIRVGNRQTRQHISLTWDPRKVNKQSWATQQVYCPNFQMSIDLNISKHYFGQLLVTLMGCQHVCDIIVCLVVFPMVFEKFPVQRVPYYLVSVLCSFYFLQYLKPLLCFMCIAWLAWWKILNACLAAVFGRKVGFCGGDGDSTHVLWRILWPEGCIT